MASMKYQPGNQLPITYMSVPPEQFTDRDPESMWEEAKAEAARARLELVRRKDILPTEEFSRELCVSDDALSKAVAEHRLFVLEVSGENFYPAFYLDPSLDRAKLEHVSVALGNLSGWHKWQFFTTPKFSLGSKEPLKVLKGKGDVETVVTAAEGFAER